MNLSPREVDKLLLAKAGWLAQKRLSNGVRLNQIEATALIACQIHELIRKGGYSVSQLQQEGREMLGQRHVMPAVIFGLQQVIVEGTFDDGTHLVVITRPISTETGNLTKALSGSHFPIPPLSNFPPHDSSLLDPSKQPGAVHLSSGRIPLHQGRKVFSMKIVNKADRPIQVGSHLHLIEANAALDFDRRLGYGKRLAIPAGASIRLEPGDQKTLSIVEFGGSRTFTGGNGMANGPFDPSRLDDIIRNLIENGYAHTPQPLWDQATWTYTMDRSLYTRWYGPTTGDRVRLSDTELWIKIEKDYAVYGEELLFGGGKVLRDGMGQASGSSVGDCLDTVITNVLILDYTGIYKADIGIQDGHIVAIGKAGNPGVMDITKSMIIGSATEIISGENKIVTAGAIDSQSNSICPHQVHEALASGVTTLICGGVGPNTGTISTSCPSGQFHIPSMLRAVDKLPLNFGIIANGSDSSEDELRNQVQLGAIGLSIHEFWGSTTAVLDRCLNVCDELDVRCSLNSDTLNESGFTENTMRIIQDRGLQVEHVEGAAGGHAPDNIVLVSSPEVLPCSGSTTIPYTVNTLDEHGAMVMVSNQGLNDNTPEDIAFAESRIREGTIKAEGYLHDIGAISIVASNSQAMGRCGEIISRTWQTASKNKVDRGALPEDANQDADNFRVRRYIAKYTINPAINYGISHLVGSIEVGKVADLVLWDFASFGVKPNLVLKSGFIAWSQMGDANGSVPAVEPVMPRPTPVLPEASISFVSQEAMKMGVKEAFGLQKRVMGVWNVSGIRKKDMKLNDKIPKVRVDPESFEVTVDDVGCRSTPANTLPLAKGFALF